MQGVPQMPRAEPPEDEEQDSEEETQATKSQWKVWPDHGAHPARHAIEGTTSVCCSVP